MRRRVLVFGHEASRSGAPRALWNSLAGIAQAAGGAWEFQVWLRGGGAELGEWRTRFAAQLISDSRSTERTLWARLWRRWVDRPLLQPVRLRRLVGRTPRGAFDLVHNNTATNGDLLPILAGLRCPIVTHVHETSTSIRRFTKPHEWRQTIAATARFIAVSTAVRDDLVADWKIDPLRINIVPNFLLGLPPVPNTAAARDYVAGRLKIGLESRLVVSIGHLDPIKAPDLFLSVLEQLKRVSEEPVHGVWIGGVRDRRLMMHLRRESVRMGIADRVHWVGALDDPSMWLAAADVVAVTSREESFSLVALEAAAIGRPVVAFAGARGPVDVLGGDDELLAPGHEVTPFAERVGSLLAQHDRAFEIGTRLRGRVEEQFLAARRVPEVLKIWEEVVNERR